MSRIAKVSLKILKWAGIVILCLIVLFFATRWIGQGINRITPKDGTDYNLLTTVLFNPWFSLGGILAFLNSQEDSFEQYLPLASAEGLKEMSLLGRYDYAMPYYNINGDIDYQTNYSLACEYFEQVNAPVKQMFVMKDGTHGLLESRSEEFSGYIHQIAK